MKHKYVKMWFFFVEKKGLTELNRRLRADLKKVIAETRCVHYIRYLRLFKD